MAGDGRFNRSGLPMFHLRRIGPPATRRGVADIMDFYEVTTMIGKSGQCHYLIDSASDMRRMYISRMHARVVIRTPSNDHKLFDDSMNGMFINNLKIINSAVLSEGDRVTFGHPQGARVPGGTRKLQPDSEYQFLFERCNCAGQMIVSNRPPGTGCNFVVPEVPVHAGKSNSKKRDRNTTQTLTTEDVLKLKEEFEQQSCSPVSAARSQTCSRPATQLEDQSDAAPLAEDNSTPSVDPQNHNGDDLHTHNAEDSSIATEDMDTETSATAASVEGPQSHKDSLQTHLPEESSSVATADVNMEIIDTASAAPSISHTEDLPNHDDSLQANFAEDSSSVATAEMNTETIGSARITPDVCRLEESPPKCDEALQRHPVKASSSAASEVLDTETEATTELRNASESSVEQDEGDNTLPREIFLQQDKKQLVVNLPERDSGPCVEGSRNSANLGREDILEQAVNVPCSDSVDSASLSIEDTFELVVNLPNNSIPLCREKHSHIYPSPFNTSTPKSKKTVTNSQVPRVDDAQISPEESSSQTSAMLDPEDVVRPVQSEKVLQTDAFIQTSPLIPLVQERPAPGSHQRRRGIVDPLHYEEEDPVIQYQEGYKGLEIDDHEQQEFERDQDIKSCASQSTDSAECPTETVVSDSVDYVGMFSDSDMDDDFADESISVAVGDNLNETVEDLSMSRTLGHTEEVYMDTTDVADKIEHVSADVNKTALVSDNLDESEIFVNDLNKTEIASNRINGSVDYHEELFNKTGNTSCDVEMEDEVQFDRTENVSENLVFATEEDETKNMTGSDNDSKESQLDKTENISEDNDGQDDAVEVNRSVIPDQKVSEIKEKDSEDCKFETDVNKLYSTQSEQENTDKSFRNEVAEQQQLGKSTVEQDCGSSVDVVISHPACSQTDCDDLNNNFSVRADEVDGNVVLRNHKGVISSAIDNVKDDVIIPSVPDESLDPNSTGDHSTKTINVDEGNGSKILTEKTMTQAQLGNNFDVQSGKDIEHQLRSCGGSQQNGSASEKPCAGDNDTETLEQQDTTRFKDKSSGKDDDNEQCLMEAGNCTDTEKGEDILDKETVQCSMDVSSSATAGSVSGLSTVQHIASSSEDITVENSTQNSQGQLKVVPVQGCGDRSVVQEIPETDVEESVNMQQIQHFTDCQISTSDSEELDDSCDIMNQSGVNFLSSNLDKDSSLTDRCMKPEADGTSSMKEILCHQSDGSMEIEEDSTTPLGELMDGFQTDGSAVTGAGLITRAEQKVESSPTEIKAETDCLIPERQELDVTPTGGNVLTGRDCGTPREHEDLQTEGSAQTETDCGTPREHEDLQTEGSAQTETDCGTPREHEDLQTEGSAQTETDCGTPGEHEDLQTEGSAQTETDCGTPGEHEDLQTEGSAQTETDFGTPREHEDLQTEGSVQTETDFGTPREHEDLQTEGSAQTETDCGTPREHEDLQTEGSAQTETDFGTPGEHEDLQTEGSVQTETDFWTPREHEDLQTEGSAQTETDCGTPGEHEDLQTEGSAQTETDFGTPREHEDLQTEGSVQTETDCGTPGEHEDLQTERSVQTETDCLTSREHEDLQTEGSAQTVTISITPTDDILDNSSTDGTVEVMTPEGQILEGSRTERSMESEEAGRTPTKEMLEGFQADENMEVNLDGLTHEDQISASITEGIVETEVECMAPERHVLEDTPTEGGLEVGCTALRRHVLECSTTKQSVGGDCKTPEEHLLDDSHMKGSVDAETAFIAPAKMAVEDLQTEGSAETTIDITSPTEGDIEPSPTDSNTEAGARVIISPEQKVEHFLTDKKIQAKKDGITPKEQRLDISTTEGSVEAETDDMNLAQQLLEGSPEVESMEAETLTDNPEQIQEGSMLEQRVEAKTDNITVLEETLKEFPTKDRGETDTKSDMCVLTEPCPVGSTSPISKNIQALQDFSKSISPLAKTIENNNNEKVFMSPASKRRKDRDDASDMISCLEDSIISVDSVSDVQDVSMSTLVVKDIPPVFILDKQFLEANYNDEAQTTLNKSILIDSRDREGQEVLDNVFIMKDVSETTDVSKAALSEGDVEMLGANKKCVLQEESCCESPTGKDKVNQENIVSDHENRDILQEITSERSRTDTDQFVGNEASRMQENLSNKTNSVKGSTMDMKSTSEGNVNTEKEKCETSEGSCASPSQGSTLEFSSVPQTDSYTSQFSESDLICQWEVDNRNLESAESVKATSGCVPPDRPFPDDVSVCATGDVTTTVSSNGPAVVLEDVSTDVSNESIVMSTDVSDESAVVSTERSAVVSTDRSAVVLTEKSAIVSTERSAIVSTERSAIMSSDESVFVSTERSAVVSTESYAVVSTDESAIVSTYRSAVVSTESSAVVSTESSAIVSTERSAFASTESHAVVSTDETAVVSSDIPGVVSQTKQVSTGVSESVSADLSIDVTARAKNTVEEALTNVDTWSPMEVTAKEEDLVGEAKELQSSEQENCCSKDTNKQGADVVMKKPFSESIDITEQDSRSDVTGPCSVETNVEPIEQSGKCYTNKLAPRKRKRTLSDSTSDDENKSGKKKRTAWYQNVKTSVSNFFKIRHKVRSSEKSSCTKQKLKKENIAKIVKHFFSYKKKHTETQKIQSEASELGNREKSSSHGDEDCMLNNFDVSGQSQGFSPCPSSDSNDGASKHPEDFDTQKSVDDNNSIETDGQKYMETGAYDVNSTANIPVLGECKDEDENRNKDFTQEKLSAGSGGLEVSIADSEEENSESLLAPLEPLVYSTTRTQVSEDIGEEQESNRSDSESLLAPVAPVEMESCENNFTSNSNQDGSMSELPTENDLDEYLDDHPGSTSDSDSQVVSVVHTGLKSSVKAEGSNLKTGIETMPGKSLLSNIPLLDPEGKTYSLSDMDSSDISIITLRSSEELECLGGNDSTEEDVKGRINMLDTNKEVGYKNRFACIKEESKESPIPISSDLGRVGQFMSKMSGDNIISPEICRNNSKLSTDHTPLDEVNQMDSMVTTNNSDMTEQNTEYTDVSSINYCPLPDFETDSSIEITTSVGESIPTNVPSSKTEITITDSSDELPEVVFLREEREKTNVHVKSEFTDEVIVKQESVSQGCCSSGSTTEDLDMGAASGVQAGLDSPVPTRRAASFLSGRVLNSPISEMSTSTPLSSVEDQPVERKKNSPKKWTKKRSPIKSKAETPGKKQSTRSKYKRRPRRKKNKSGNKCCDDDIIELITDSDSDENGPSNSKFPSPINSVQKRSMMNRNETELVGRSPAKYSCKSNDLQDDLGSDLVDDIKVDHMNEAGAGEKTCFSESGRESSVQDIFNSEEFGEDSSLPASFSEAVFRTIKGSVADTEDTSTSSDLGDCIHSNIEKDKELESENITIIYSREDPAEASDEFSCQGDPTMGESLEESMDDNDSAPSPFSPPPPQPSDDEVIPNTCDEDDDIDMHLPVLPPLPPLEPLDSVLPPLEPLDDVTPSQCLSPIFPDVTKTFDVPVGTGDRSVEGASEMFDSDEEFSIPHVDWDAFEDSDEKMNEESKSSGEGDDHEIQDVEDNISDDASPMISPRHSDRDHISDGEETDDKSITTTPRPDDFTVQSTSTGFKRRALFSEDDEEMDETPSPKRARTKCTSKTAFTKISPASKLKKAFDEDMLISTQCPLVTDMSESQLENASRMLCSREQNTAGSAKKRKTKEFLNNVQAKLKKYKTKKESTPVQSESAASSQETPGNIPVASSVQRRILTEAEVSNGRITDYLTRCKDVIGKLGQALDRPKLHTFPRVSQWRKDLSEVEDKTVLPKTTIAVVGDTGSGKSSLMNAVIDQHNTLPTSGMRACTAVVVEVLANTTSSNFEADIKFLSHKEWFDELHLLISDLTTADGKLKKSVPDQDSEAGVAFLKVKAVYGKVDTIAALSRLTPVTRMLDKVETIRATNPKDFRRRIDRYIETADPGAGGQYWPIVKQVTIRMPNCDACSSGAILVDLPGVRDSNAARDRIARNYLKNCTVVWVVAAIHRAINNKTAKDMLGENFRRQLLMDGQYGSVAFVCTKSDDIMPSEIMRNLKLDDACESSEKEIQSLLMEKKEAERTVGRLKKEIRSIGKDLKELTSDIADMKETIEETTAALEGDVIDLDSEETDGIESLKELRLVVLDKEESLATIQEEKVDKEKGMDKATRKFLEIEKKIELKRKEISAFCAKARNDYSKTQIKRDFKAGLREMKRKAGLTNRDEDDEMEDEDQDYNSDDDDEEMGQTAENLRVFCVSSMEYQKMKNLLTNDGPPNVFSSTEETQIPVLRRYIHELTSVRGQQHVDRLIRTLGQLVFDIQSYIMADGTTCKGTRRDAKSAVEENSQELQEKFEPILSRLSHEIEQTFNDSIETKMADGVTSAMCSANDTVSKWGAKRNREERGEGGFHWKTYQCIVRRQGVYNSKTYGNIDFNEQLSEPMYRCISVCWDKVFSGLLWRALEDCKSMLLMTLTVFVRELCEKLNKLEVPRNQTDRVSAQLCHSAKDKLAEMLTNLKELVLSRQRDISRVITPTVQDNLDQTYSYCGGEAGSGMFMRMKEAMAGGVDYKRLNMFSLASQSLLQDLHELKEEIVSHVRSVCLALCLMLQAAFEPLWEAPSQTKLLKDILFDSVTEAVLSVTSLHTDANLSLPVAPARDSSSDQNSPTSVDRTLTDPADQDPNDNAALPGPSGLQVAKTNPVGPQMYTMTYGMTQKLVTDSHGKTHQVSMETSKSAQVTDVLKHLKQEPESTKLLSSTSIKKEWDASSNFEEVSGPELRWLQNTIPNLDLHTETGSSVGQPKSVGTPRCGLPPPVPSIIPQPAGGSQSVGNPRPGLPPPVPSTITQPAGGSQSIGIPRFGLPPPVPSTITQPAGGSQSIGIPRFGLPPPVPSTITQPACGSQSIGIPRFGLPPPVPSTVTKSTGSSQSVGTPRFGFTPRVPSTITQPAGGSQSGRTLRLGLSPRVSSTITQSAGIPRSGLSSRIPSSLAQSQSVDTPRSSVHCNKPSVTTASRDRTVTSKNTTSTTGVHQSPDCTARQRPAMGLGDILNSTVRNQLTDMLAPSVPNYKSASTSQTANIVRNRTISAINSLLQKGIDVLNKSEVTSGSAVGSSRSQGNQTALPKAGHFSLQPEVCKNFQPKPVTTRGNIPPLSPKKSQNQQATGNPVAALVGKKILSALSSSSANKTLLSIVNKSLITQLQNKQKQSSSTSSSHSSSASLSTSGRSSTVNNSPPVTGTYCTSPSTNVRSPTFNNSPPVTGTTSSSNRARLRLSLKKASSTPDTPTYSGTRIKQEQVEGATGQQRRVRRANNSSYGLINLCDSSDSDN